jgi:MarR family transcriptional regulator, organic hydroperoxide resistance regulator
MGHNSLRAPFLAADGRAVTDLRKVNLSDYLPYLVNRVGSIIAEQFAAETLAPHRLSIALWRVMAVLAANGRQRQIDLADLTSIDASTLSRIVTRLVRLNLVTRTRSATSNREVAVALSAKGSALVARLIPDARAMEAAAAAGISPAELAVVKRCLRRMYGNMKNRTAAAAAATAKRVAV